MSAVQKTLRNQLERTVKQARDIAEAGAKAALDMLGVGDAIAPSYLDDARRNLRRRLRIHGRQLGDAFQSSASETAGEGERRTQELGRLTEEVAYEHWHRMLFAKFLAENNLLMYPDAHSPVAVSLAECEDLAVDEGARNGWELAARFAARMLPQIFRVDSPVFELELPPEHQQELEKLLSHLPPEVFVASDSLGWVYQFWQARRKAEVNIAGKKIGEQELPAVTQLFTEDYMVDFLLDNTLGAWYAGRVLETAGLLSDTAADEEALRHAVSLPRCPWNYLRFNRSAVDKWSPVVGAFNTWPKSARELKCIDPCMGSGHFVVAMFERLTALRMAEESIDETTAVMSVIRENLFGLEIDGRCTQIAAFNLALAAWRRVGYRPLPSMNLACSGLAPNVSKAVWLELAADNEKLETSIEQLYELFLQAPILGSLINPSSKGANLFAAGFPEVQPLLDLALARETIDDREREMTVLASGLAKAAGILSVSFTLVATNVPFLGREKQCKALETYIDDHYLPGKADLACAMQLRCMELCSLNGHVATVSPQYWLFLGRYEAFRRHMLTNTSLGVVAKLGTGAFETITGEVVNTCLTIATRNKTCNSAFVSIDGGSSKGPLEKQKALISAELEFLLQKDQEKNPNLVIGYKADDTKKLLLEYCYCYQGLATSDNSQFIRQFWEHPELGHGWEPFQMAPEDSSTPIGGLSWVILWENGNGKYARHAAALKAEGRLGGWKSGHEAWGKRGVAINRMSSLPVALYGGAMFDCNVAVLIPHDPQDLAWIWSFLRSDEYRKEVRRLTQKTSVTNLTLIKIPVDKEEQIQLEAKNTVKPIHHTINPTQWLFDGNPKESDNPLQVAVARLLGYRWPRQTGSRFPDCTSIECDMLDSLSDKDGIVCIPSVRGERCASDRLLNLLAQAYGNAWSNDVLAGHLSAVGYAGKSLESWLRDGFFAQHCELFHQRPFVWHIWDGLRDGFSALVNYHTLDRKNLETLIYTYLGDWITRHSHDVASGVDNAKEKLAGAEQLKKRLELILEGDAPYDIFVRWKPLHQQPIGWEPDINDGVRVNIRPFVSVPDVKSKNAGVLRVQPGIKWGKDKGKEANRPKDEFPWFWGWDGYTTDFTGVGTEPTGERFNDCHYTLKCKNMARNEKHTEGGTSK